MLAGNPADFMGLNWYTARPEKIAVLRQSAAYCQAALSAIVMQATGAEVGRDWMTMELAWPFLSQYWLVDEAPSPRALVVKPSQISFWGLCRRLGPS